MYISKRAVTLIFAMLGVVIFYSVIMAITAFGFIMDGYMTWYEKVKPIAILEFGVVIAVLCIAVYLINLLDRKA